MRFILFIVCSFLFSCLNKTNSTHSNSQSSFGDSTSVISIIDKSSVEHALQIVSGFSKSFQPDSSAYEGIGTLRNVPDSVIHAFKILRQTDTLSHKKYLTVILLKLYLDHLRCCHQSYEIRENPYPSGVIDSIADPLIYEFNIATKMFGTNEHREFISSGIANYYVETHKELLKYPEIKEVVDKMKPVADSIDKHLYWK